MKKHYRIRYLKPFGVPIYIHWHLFVAIPIAAFLTALNNQPFLVIITILSYLSIILIHECGHAYFAKRYNRYVNAIYVGLFHGVCETTKTDSDHKNLMICLGGVIAQLIIAIPLVILSLTTPIGEIWGAGSVITFCGYFSIGMAIVNLAPAEGLDGEKAWEYIKNIYKNKQISVTNNNNKAKKKRKFKVVK